MPRAALLATSLLALSACHPRELAPVPSPSPSAAPIALVNGTILTFPSRAPAQTAIIERGRFTCVGAPGECVAPGAKTLDLHGGTAVPGIIDAHGHVLELGRRLREVDLRGCRDETECAARVAERARSAPPGGWIIGGGWDQTKWPGARFPSRESLDRVAGDHPVFLERVDGHAAWVNGRALAAANIDARTRDPAGGRIARDPGDAPTGLLIDGATELVEKVLPTLTEAEIREALVSAMKELAAAGITSVHDAGVDARTLAVYRDLADKDAMPIRVYAMLDGSQPMESLVAEMEAWKKTPSIGRLTVRAVKLFADGALGSRGAWLKEPYSDDPQNRGLARTPPEELRAKILAIARAGFQPAVHAIGDRACQETLADFVLARKEVPSLRPRVEHLQVLDPGDRGLLVESGAVASMQPTHATSDGSWAELRLGHDTRRLDGAYAWKSVLRLSVPLACGSDFPVESFDPRLGLYSAETRRWPGGPAEGWRREEALTREEALRCFTAGGAFAEQAEDRRGRIAVGYDADVTVFAAPYLTAAPETLRDTPIAATIVGGRVEFAR